MINILQGLSSNLSIQNAGIAMYFASFFGGVLSSLSPCTLGILPLIIAYAGLDKNEGYLKVFLKLFCLILGIATIMTTAGILSAFGGKVLIALGGNYWIILIGSLFVIFGLSLLGVIEISYINIFKKMPNGFEKHQYLFAYIVGIIFALGATPCATPILAGILGYASITKNILNSAIMLFLFSLGQGVILIFAGLFTSYISKLHKFDKITEIILKFAGILMVICGLFVWYKVFTPLIESIL